MTDSITRSALAALLLAMPAVASSGIKVHTFGDSTMAPYDEGATVTRGWGMYLGNFLSGDVTSANYARGGRDARGGYEELWTNAKSQVKAGDYVIIQFGHNDEKNGGMDGYELKAYYESTNDATALASLDLRGTVPSTTYKEYLGKIVDEAKALGATPIIASPVCRNGRHDLGGSFSELTESGPKTGLSVAESDHKMDYPYHAKQLAEEKGVAFIDMTTATKDLYESYGASKCEAELFDGNGSTHFNTTGAVLVARLCAQLLLEQGILSDYISLPTDLSVAPDMADMGKGYVGQTLVKELTINGFGLTPSSGTVAVSATEGLLLSTDKTNWQPSLSVDYSGATLVSNIYAQTTLSSEGAFAGQVTLTCGDQTVNVPVSAEAIVLKGGADVTAYWRLENDDTYELTGPANVEGEKMVGMYVQRYANPNAKTVWPEETGYDATRKMQRTLIEGDTWPDGEIDDNPDRYIEFAIKPNVGMTLSIDKLSLFLCGAGGNGMCAHVYFSTDGWLTRTTIFEGKKMVANNPQLIEATPVVELGEDQTLSLRIYPWYNGSANGKTLCISDITIQGMASTAEQADALVAPSAEEKQPAYYRLNGIRSGRPARGLNVKTYFGSDGKHKASLVRIR